MTMTIKCTKVRILSKESKKIKKEGTQKWLSLVCLLFQKLKKEIYVCAARTQRKNKIENNAQDGNVKLKGNELN